VARLIRLAAVYGIPAERLVADVNGSAEGVTAPRAIDVAVLEAFEGTDAEIVAAFIREVACMRDEDLPDVVILRSGDLEVLVSASGRPPTALLDAIRHAVIDA
jgi:hypothetical protein